MNNTTKLYKLSDAKLKSQLVNHVVTYANEGPSSIKQDGIRTFLIEEVMSQGFSKKDRRRYVTAYTRDLDDGAQRKYRTLHVGGITKVSGRIGTAARMVKSLF
jgi:hypothetical protein